MKYKALYNTEIHIPHGFKARNPHGSSYETLPYIDTFESFVILPTIFQNYIYIYVFNSYSLCGVI